MEEREGRGRGIEDADGAGVFIYTPSPFIFGLGCLDLIQDLGVATGASTSAPALFALVLPSPTQPS